MTTKATRAALVLLVAGLAVLTWTPEAAAGGMDWLYPLHDRYEPGETATVVGYTVRSTDTDPDILDWSDTGPFHGYLRVDPEAGTADPEHPWWPVPDPSDVDLGEPTVAATSHRDGYLAVRVSLSFAIPPDLPPRGYEILICQQDCSMTLGYIGGATVYIGVDPLLPIVRSWPIDDPAIDDLADDALLWSSSGKSVTAAQVRTGEIPPALKTPPDTSTTTTTTTTTTTARPGSRVDRSSRSDLAGTVPWLLAFALLVGLWCGAWRLGGGKDRPPRKRISNVSTASDDPSDLPSDHHLHIRL